MQRLMTSQRGVEDLEAFQCGAAGRTVPLFHGWSTTEFGEFVSSRHTGATSKLVPHLPPAPPAPRRLVWPPAGVLQSGGEPEATDPAGGGPHPGPGPEPGLPVLLAAPALHLPKDQVESGGPAAGDWPPPPLSPHPHDCTPI